MSFEPADRESAVTRAPSTLRTRLVVASILVSVFALLVANSLAYFGLRRTLISQIDASLRTVELPKSDRGPRFRSSFYFAELDTFGGTSHEVLATDDQGKTVRPRLPRNLDLTGTTSEPTGVARFMTVAAVGSGSRFRVKASRYDDGRVLILAATLDDTERTLGRTLHNQVLITIAVTVLTALLASFGIRRNLRPLTRLQQTAVAIANGDRNARTIPAGGSDIQELSTTFNSMVDELSRSIASEKDATARTRMFVDDAAHELRTPTTAVLAYAQLLRNDRVRSAEENRRITQGILTEGDRLKRLIDELLFLARSDQLAVTADRDGIVDLGAIATHAVDASLAVGPSWPLDLETPDQCWVRCSPAEMRQVFDNLLANIRTHTPAGTAGRLRIENNHDGAVITVEDDGPGLDPEHTSQVFDRFWRGDESRTRTTGGNGLGLSIVKAIIDAHGGSVRAESRPGGGTRITVHLGPRVSQLDD